MPEHGNTSDGRSRRWEAVLVVLAPILLATVARMAVLPALAPLGAGALGLALAAPAMALVGARSRDGENGQHPVVKLLVLGLVILAGVFTILRH